MMPVMNGELFLPQALQSLLAQDYKDFELIILDNMSTDRTPAICEEFAARDARVRYILDDTNRISHDAANHLASFITGEYCMIACDDDLWAPNFLSCLVSCLEEHPELGLAYSNGVYVDIDNHIGDGPFLRGRQVYRARHSRFSNFWDYLGMRRVVPILFGVYRSTAYMRALPFDTFDETIADVDNLFMLKVLSKVKVHCINENLFYYRNKFRWADPDLLLNYPKDKNLIKVWLYDLKHQVLFTQKVFDVIQNSSFTISQRAVIRARISQCLVAYMTSRRLRSWVGRLLAKLGLRQGVTQTRDLSADIRHDALQDRSGGATISDKHG